MPTSSTHIIPVVCDMLQRRAPRRILDIGIGLGKYGMLAREYSDVTGSREPGETVVDGIEIFAPYIGPIQRAIYGDIFIGDAVNVLPKLGRYDFAICVDVLEHMERERGVQLLEGIKAVSESAIVTTPVKMLPQGAAWGNVHETHVCQWSEFQLKCFGRVQMVGEVKPTWILIIQ